jgi:hypothetical protein
LGIKCLIIKGYSQLVVNFSNKSYTPKDEHMVDYLKEHRKMEKRFQGLELKHILEGIYGGGRNRQARLSSPGAAGRGL